MITVLDELDYEAENSYQLTVRASDSYSSKWAEVTVSVQVVDVNDNPPEFMEYFYNVTVSEATAIASEILKVTSMDKDTENNKGVSYRLENFNGTIPEHFYMEGSSGALILKKGLDREKITSHHFTIVATDTGSPPLSSTANVLISGNIINMLYDLMFLS